MLDNKRKDMPVPRVEQTNVVEKPMESLKCGRHKKNNAVKVLVLVW